jgi:hypothetical protein
VQPKLFVNFYQQPTNFAVFEKFQYPHLRDVDFHEVRVFAELLKKFHLIAYFLDEEVLLNSIHQNFAVILPPQAATLPIVAEK